MRRGWLLLVLSGCGEEALSTGDGLPDLVTAGVNGVEVLRNTSH